MGDHVLFYSSEHASGKGPQLVVEGRRGKAKFAADPAKRYNSRYVMPRQDSTFRRYLRERNFRYVNWTTDPVVGLRGEQRIYPYYWDVVVYGEYILPNAYYPFSQSILGLDGMIERQDREGLRRFQINRLRYLHIWEYTREQRWYDCGDIIEIFSPLQAAYIWLGSKKDNGLTFDGVLNKVHPKGRKNLTRQEIQLHRLAEVEEQADKRNILVTTRDVASDVQVQASKSLMDLAIGNLLRNAIMHNISSGTLDIAARQEHCAIIVTITNSTDETLPDDLMNLKQPFHRGEHSRISAEPGVGLGLSIADAACEAMGATLELDRPDEQSFRATITIASA